MDLIPAIDLRNGGCVRLYKGDFGHETRYDQDPVALAKHYRALGARWLHVVDLDGAKRGAPAHLALVAEMKSASGLRVQFGGGLRDRATLDAALAVVDRAVVGSLAVTNETLVASWLGDVGRDRITLALDVRLDAAGTAHVATHGWTRDSTLTLADALGRYEAVGLRHVLCTDIDRDGALVGPNLELYAECVRRWPDVAFIASGGVRDARDLSALAATNVAAAVSGKALLEGRITEEELKPFLPDA